MADDVELCLEVQVDPASKKILANPEKCRSALLDVTVVKPKELESFGTKKTNTLRADQVRKLISSMEKERRQKQKALDKLKFEDTIIQIRKHEDLYESHHRLRTSPTSRRKERVTSKSPVADDLERKDFIGIAESVEPLFCEIRRSLKNVETRITDMQDIGLCISESNVDESPSEDLHIQRKPRGPLTTSHPIKNQQSVYRVETVPHNLKSVLCSNYKQKHKSDTVEEKCLCENCGIVGLLTECQEHPLLAELSESPPLSEHRQLQGVKKRAKVNFIKSLDNSKRKNSNEIYINQLHQRVKMLEEKLAMQEERVVPKDYFRRIITKMMTNFSPKAFKSKSDTSLHCAEKNTRKHLTNEKTSTHRSRSRSLRSDPSRFCKSRESSHEKNRSRTRRSGVIKNDKSTITENDVYYSGAYMWKWGEEILKPGIDLKNKIVTLLNEVLSKFNLNEQVRKEPITRADDTTRSDEYNSEIFKRFMKHMQTKIYNAQNDNRPNFMSPDQRKVQAACNFEPFDQPTVDYSKKNRNYHSKKNVEKYSKEVDVSYINPKLSLWRTESPETKNIDSKLSEQLGKQEFLKIVSKAKQHQKDILWKNIWNQATANGQTKKDLITIKIPGQSKDKKGRQKMYEAEITIGEVEEILKRTK